MEFAVTESDILFCKELSSDARVLWLAIQTKRIKTVTTDLLSELTGIAKRQVVKALGELRKLGLLITTRRGNQPSMYEPVDIQEAAPLQKASELWTKATDDPKLSLWDKNDPVILKGIVAMANRLFNRSSAPGAPAAVQNKASEWVAHFREEYQRINKMPCPKNAQRDQKQMKRIMEFIPAEYLKEAITHYLSVSEFKYQTIQCMQSQKSLQSIQVWLDQKKSSEVKPISMDEREARRAERKLQLEHMKAKAESRKVAVR